jgi:hypothetical protein
MPKPRKHISPTLTARVRKALDAVRSAKIVPLSAVREGKAAAEAASEAVLKPEDLADLHPAHALYMVTLDRFQAIAEKVSQLPELDKLAEIVARADDEYCPSAPPMSPITLSFFNTWAFFDAAVGGRQETLGTIVRDLGSDLGLHPNFVRILDLLCNSRMGLYVVENDNPVETVVLRELVTNRTLECVNLTGFDGRRGRVWFARVLPPPSDELKEHIVFTTPYEVLTPGEAGWMRFLDRTIGRADDGIKGYEGLLKWGRTPRYWLEYAFCAYAGHQTEAIQLMGVPDVPASLPHSRINEDNPTLLDRYIASGKMERGEPA